jgi:hypothetical protein
VQVKSLSSRTSFICQKSLLEPQDNLFFILVVLSRALSQRPEYFVLNHEQFLQVIKEQERWMREEAKKRSKPYAEFAPGFNYSVMAKFNFVEAWENLPQ